LAKPIKGISLPQSFLIFGIAAILLYFETHFLIPFLSQKTGLEPILFWFLVAGLGLFLPMLILAYLLLKKEGVKINRRSWADRLRFRKMNPGDWTWSVGAVVVISLLSLGIIKIIEALIGAVHSTPPFMSFEPLTPDRFWILLVWLPYWFLNIMGEEILWRGVLLPRQEQAFGRMTWLLHGFAWGVFHLAFGWQFLVMLIPLLFIQSYVVQRRKNSWTGVFIHAVINGPSFIAIALGLL